jgi:hypothetical protein
MANVIGHRQCSSACPRSTPVFGGWELNGILTAQSGQSYSGLLDSDLNNDITMATSRPIARPNSAGTHFKCSRPYP